jgi:hypothetical protein
MAIETKEDVLSRDFPAAIVAAQTRFAMHVSNWTLDVKAIRLAQIYISHTPLCALDAPVVCSRQKAADLLGVHVRTITRLAVMLEDAGIIDRLPQIFGKNGKPGCMRLKWTDAGKTLFASVTQALRPHPFPSSNPQRLSSSAMQGLPAAPVSEAKRGQTKFDRRDSEDSISNGPAQMPRGTNLSHISTSSCKQELSSRPCKSLKAL